MCAESSPYRLVLTPASRAVEVLGNSGAVDAGRLPARQESWQQAVDTTFWTGAVDTGRPLIAAAADASFGPGRGEPDFLAVASGTGGIGPCIAHLMKLHSGLCIRARRGRCGSLVRPWVPVFLSLVGVATTCRTDRSVSSQSSASQIVCNRVRFIRSGEPPRSRYSWEGDSSMP